MRSTGRKTFADVSSTSGWPHFCRACLVRHAGFLKPFLEESTLRASTEGAKPGTGWRDIAIEMITGLREAVWRFPVPALLLFASTLQAHLHIAEVHWFTVEANGQPTD